MAAAKDYKSSDGGQKTNEDVRYHKRLAMDVDLNGKDGISTVKGGSKSSVKSA